jgi:8-amino-7-oxononanoate synthase
MNIPMTPHVSTDAKREMLRRMLRDRMVTERPMPAPAPGSRPRSSIEQLLGADRAAAYLELEQRNAAFAASGLSNPYFRAIDGIAAGTATIGGSQQINFSSYNYLGLSGEPRVVAAAKLAIDMFGTSVSASRIVSGERLLHQDLEKALAELTGVEAAIIFVSGHATNVTTIGHLFGPRDLLLHDSLIHNSILVGCQLSGAARLAFPHNDAAAADAILQRVRDRYERVAILIEGVYSMDGDIAPLPDILAVKRRHNAMVYVDEAHALGVLGAQGRGIAEHFGIDPQEIDIWMGTLSKSLAGCGGYIAGSRLLIDYLKYTAPGSLFSVGMPPPVAAASLRAIEVLRAEPHRVATLRARAALFAELARAAGLDIGTSRDTAVVPVIVGDARRALALSLALSQRGINVPAALFPTVPEGGARLRFFISSTHEESQIHETVMATAQEIARLSS